MDEKIAQEILHELLSSLEALETQSAALLQFVKDKGLASEQDLAPYFEQAGNASNIRWRAARVRIEHLLAAAFKDADQKTQQESSKPEGKNEQSSRNTSAEPAPNKEDAKETKEDSQPKLKEAARAKLEGPDASPGAEGNSTQPQNNPENEQRNVKDETAQDKQNAGKETTRKKVKEKAA
jgi:chemotaxis protein histidine kinase CheA